MLEKLPNCTDQESRAGSDCASFDTADLVVEGRVSSPDPAAVCAPNVATEGGALGGSAGCTAEEEADSAGRGVEVAPLVDKSTETLRVGTGKLTDDDGDDSRCGPDNNSGTISTISTTKIVAPIRRSLTRRSMSMSILFMIIGWRSIFGKARRRQDTAGLEPIHCRPDRVERAEHHDPVLWARGRRRRGAG